MGIQAIQTEYQDCKFRSRLEARWAVFMDHIKTEWEYEKEGFIIDGNWYLPDFWIPYRHIWDAPDAGFWLEIKPVDLSEIQIHTLCKLAEYSGHRTYAICGEPWPGKHKVYTFQHHRGGRPNPLYRTGHFIETPKSFYPGYRDFEVSIRENIFLDLDVSLENFGVLWHCSPFDCDWDELAVEARTNRSFLQRAFRAARSARFEHA